MRTGHGNTEGERKCRDNSNKHLKDTEGEQPMIAVKCETPLHQGKGEGD